MKAEFDAMPLPIIREGNKLRLFFGFEPVEVEYSGETTTKYRGTNVDIEGDHSYGTLVSAIIRDKYPDDKRDAIFANRELVKDNPEHEKAAIYLAEYEAFQEYRLYAKSVAQSVIENL